MVRWSVTVEENSLPLIGLIKTNLNKYAKELITLSQLSNFVENNIDADYHWKVETRYGQTVIDGKDIKQRHISEIVFNT